jgi:ABC-type amino acid transport substrate-binding protein
MTDNDVELESSTLKLGAGQYGSPTGFSSLPKWFIAMVAAGFVLLAVMLIVLMVQVGDLKDDITESSSMGPSSAATGVSTTASAAASTTDCPTGGVVCREDFTVYLHDGWPRYSYRDDDGKMQGFLVEVVRAMQKYSNGKLHLLTGPDIACWDEKDYALEGNMAWPMMNKDFDGCFTSESTRKNEMGYFSSPIAHGEPLFVYYRKGETLNLDDVKGKVYARASGAGVSQTCLHKNGFTTAGTKADGTLDVATMVKFFDDGAAAFAAVQNGEADYTIHHSGDSNVFDSLKLDLKFCGSDSISILHHKENAVFGSFISGLHRQVVLGNDMVQLCKSDLGLDDLCNGIYYDMARPPIAPVPVSCAERHFTILINDAWPRFSYRDADGELKGFWVELTNHLIKYSEGRLHGMVGHGSLCWDGKAAGGQGSIGKEMFNRDFDGCFTAISDRRAAVMSYSTTMGRTPDIYLIWRKGESLSLDNLRGKRGALPLLLTVTQQCLSKNGYTTAGLRADGTSDPSLITYTARTSEAFADVMDGRADYMFGRNFDEATLATVNSVVVNLDYCGVKNSLIMGHKDDPHFMEFLNGLFQKVIDNGDMIETCQKEAFFNASCTGIYY